MIIILLKLNYYEILNLKIMEQIFLVRSKGTARRKPKVEFIPDENEPFFPYKTLIYNGIIFSAYHRDNKIFIKPDTL